MKGQESESFSGPFLNEKNGAGKTWQSLVEMKVTDSSDLLQVNDGSSKSALLQKAFKNTIHKKLAIRIKGVIIDLNI